MDINMDGNEIMRSVRKMPWAVQPGEFCVISTGSRAGPWITFAEQIVNHGKRPLWDHVVIASRWENDILYIVEAQPHGAVEVPWHYGAHPYKWSTGIVDTPFAAGEASRKYIGVGYSFLDYEAIALHYMHIPIPHVEHYINDTGHMICSQLVNQAETDAGKNFWPGEWVGYAMPSDFGRLLGS